MNTTLRLLCLAALAAAGPLHGQSARHPYPHGIQRLLPAAEQDSLRTLLKEGRWVESLKFFFGDVYSREFSDLIIYIDRQGRVSQAFVTGDQALSRPVLHGTQLLYAIIFAEDTVIRPGSLDSSRLQATWGADPTRPQVARIGLAESAAGMADRDMLREALLLNRSADTVLVTVSQPRGTRQLRIRRTAENHREDPFLSGLVRALASKLVFGGVPQTPVAPRDTSVVTDLRPVSGDTTAPRLYVAMQSFAIAPNTWNRVTTMPAHGTDLPGARAIISNFSNTSPSRFGVGLGMGVTVNARTLGLSDTTLVSEGQEYHPNLYVLGHWFFRDQPELPLRPRAASLFLGTNLIAGSLLDEIVAGLAVTRIKRGGDAGIALGVNFLESRLAGNRQRTWIGRPFLALTFQL